jgi:D-amino peptidase
MTNLEGVAGVIDSVNWCLWDGRYYEAAKELLTEEINAAVRGFKAAGASEFHVIDGHGPGAIDIRLLDPDVEYARGWPHKWPFGLDGSYDAVAFVGQHAKASSERAHLAHTQNMGYIDLSVNGISIGEFGQLTFCAAELGVPVIFGSGDAAFTREAVDLIPGIETVCVKRGVATGSGEECNPDEYRKRNAAAVHIPPARAHGLIEAGAKRAVERFKSGEIKLRRLDPPYECVTIFRADGERPRRETRKTHPSSFIALMNS